MESYKMTARTRLILSLMRDVKLERIDMIQRIAVLLVGSSLLGACATTGQERGEEPSGLTCERKEFRDAESNLTATANTYRRDGERILVSVRYTGHRPRDLRNSGWNTFYMHNRPVMIETDKTGDWTNVTVRVFGTDLDDFEEFTRHADGTVAPVTAGELAELRAEQAQLNRELSVMTAIIKAAIDSNTNDVEAMEDIREAAEVMKGALEEEQTEHGD
jgi:hypothetical protein